MTERKIRSTVQRRSLVESLAEDLQALDPVLQRLYSSRGIESAEQIDYALQRLLPISSLDGIDAAVQLLLQHRHDRITIIGDFDADGATSTALVIRCLREYRFADINYLVPNRFDFGYGLTPEIVRVAAALKPELLITVDNGVSSVAGVEEAHKLGIKVLITDHHLPGEKLPDADAMVNPNLSGSRFNSPNLAGVGVAFYLMAATGRALENDGFENASRIVARYLDLVALGTVADVVPLDHNNRILVRQGLERIRAGRAVAGINAIFSIGRRDTARAVSTDLGFVVAPRLNAAGRLEDMSVGIECLLTDNPDAAAKFAADLDRINRERKTIEERMRREAFAYVDDMDARYLPACVCLFDKQWHQGIVGLIAARVRERCDRPVIAFARESDELLKGSARSVPGVHIRDLLEAVSSARPGLIDKFGGHAMAAGLTLAEKHFSEFSELAAEKLASLYPNADFSGALVVDGGLPRTALNLEFAKLLRDAGPWGSGFPEPLFSDIFLLDSQRTVGESHLKLTVRTEAGGRLIDAIAFGQAGPAYRDKINLTYRLDVNEFRGVETPQLIVEQIAQL